MQIEEPKNVTEIEFKNKEKYQYKIKDENTKDAAGFALVEARKWDRASFALYKDDSLRSQTCVNALFSIELYLKAILLILGKNVTTEKYGHRIYDMYNELDVYLKQRLKRNVKVDKVIKKSLFNEIITFNTFEEELAYISNDFMFLRYEYEKFINGMQIITLTDFIMFLKDNCRKAATRIFGRMINMEQQNKIEIIEGHDTSSYFWIMPVKIIDYNKPTNDIYNVDEYREQEISIEEEIISDFLFKYLNKNFDSELKENKKRTEMICGNIFEWNLEYNYYTIEAIEKIIRDIQEDIEKIKNKEFNEKERIENMGSYLYYYMHKQDTKDKSVIFWNYKEIVIEFYERFIEYLVKMIKESKKYGYKLISFMGP